MMKNITTMHGVLMAYNFKNRKEMNQKRHFKRIAQLPMKQKRPKRSLNIEDIFYPNTLPLKGKSNSTRYVQ